MLFVKDFFGEPFSLDTRGCPFYNHSLKNYLPNYFFKNKSGRRKKMAFKYEKLNVEQDGMVVIAAINHPPANSMGQGVLRDLNDLLDKCENEDYPNYPGKTK